MNALLSKHHHNLRGWIGSCSVISISSPVEDLGSLLGGRLEELAGQLANLIIYECCERVRKTERGQARVKEGERG